MYGGWVNEIRVREFGTKEMGGVWVYIGHVDINSGVGAVVVFGGSWGIGWCDMSIS